MAYRWHYTAETGADVSGPGVDFADQTEAEDWLGTHWAGLVDDGVDEVTLFHDAAVVYGPMSLHPPET